MTHVNLVDYTKTINVKLIDINGYFIYRKVNDILCCYCQQAECGVCGWSKAKLTDVYVYYTALFLYYYTLTLKYKLFKSDRKKRHINIRNGFCCRRGDVFACIAYIWEKNVFGHVTMGACERRWWFVWFVRKQIILGRTIVQNKLTHL